MKIEQHEIDAQIQQVIEVRMRYGTALPAAICATSIGRGAFSLGFRFMASVVGDVINNGDGSQSVVLATA